MLGLSMAWTTDWIKLIKWKKKYLEIFSYLLDEGIAKYTKETLNSRHYVFGGTDWERAKIDARLAGLPVLYCR